VRIASGPGLKRALALCTALTILPSCATLIGVGVGGAAGAGIGYAAEQNHGGDVATATFIGAGVGLLFGAIIDFARWKKANGSSTGNHHSGMFPS
jgi:hypothetical protein